MPNDRLLMHLDALPDAARTAEAVVEAVGTTLAAHDRRHLAERFEDRWAEALRRGPTGPADADAALARIGEALDLTVADARERAQAVLEGLAATLAHDLVTYLQSRLPAPLDGWLVANPSAPPLPPRATPTPRSNTLAAGGTGRSRTLAEGRPDRGDTLDDPNPRGDEKLSSGR
jgi:uncharacterized protein (DUF2267 family)